MSRYFLILFTILFTGCSTLKIVEVDPETGYFPGTKQAAVVKEISVDLDQKKSLVLVPDGDYTKSMIANIGYFDKVIDFGDLQDIIIKENLTELVPSVNDRIGVNKSAKAYKPFLWIKWKTRQDGNKKYQQLVLLDPISLEEYFVTETLLDYVWAGVSDQNNYFPMMNSLIDYIKNNSETF